LGDALERPDGWELLGSAEDGGDGGAEGAADVESGGEFGVWDLELLGDFVEELLGGPADHGDACCADGVALGDESAGGVDAAVAGGRGEAFRPVVGAVAGAGFAEDFCAECGHDGEAVVDFSDLDLGRGDAGHTVGGVHGVVCAGGLEDAAEGWLEGVNGGGPAEDLDAGVGLEAEAGETGFGGQDDGGVSVGDLGAVVGFERQAVDEVAVGAGDGGGLIESEGDVAHLGEGVVVCVGVLVYGDGGEVGL